VGLTQWLVSGSICPYRGVSETGIPCVHASVRTGSLGTYAPRISSVFTRSAAAIVHDRRERLNLLCLRSLPGAPAAGCRKLAFHACIGQNWLELARHLYYAPRISSERLKSVVFSRKETVVGCARRESSTRAKAYCACAQLARCTRGSETGIPAPCVQTGKVRTGPSLFCNLEASSRES
jgi:hypothetical protein